MKQLYWVIGVYAKLDKIIGQELVVAEDAQAALELSDAKRWARERNMKHDDVSWVSMKLSQVEFPEPEEEAEEDDDGDEAA